MKVLFKLQGGTGTEFSSSILLYTLQVKVCLMSTAEPVSHGGNRHTKAVCCRAGGWGGNEEAMHKNSTNLASLHTDVRLKDTSILCVQASRSVLCLQNII